MRISSFTGRARRPHPRDETELSLYLDRIQTGLYRVKPHASRGGPGSDSPLLPSGGRRGLRQIAARAAARCSERAVLPPRHPLGRHRRGDRHCRRRQDEPLPQLPFEGRVGGGLSARALGALLEKVGGDGGAASRPAAKTAVGPGLIDRPALAALCLARLPVHQRRDRIPRARPTRAARRIGQQARSAPPPARPRQGRRRARSGAARRSTHLADRGNLFLRGDFRVARPRRFAGIRGQGDDQGANRLAAGLDAKIPARSRIRTSTPQREVNHSAEARVALASTRRMFPSSIVRNAASTEKPASVSMLPWKLWVRSRTMPMIVGPTKPPATLMLLMSA